MTIAIERPSGETTADLATDVDYAMAFHRHVLTHAEGPDEMFGMVTAMIVEE